MRLHHLLPIAGLALTAACASSGSSTASGTEPSPATRPFPNDPPTQTAGASWNGELRPESGSSVAGTVAIAPAATAGSSTATITVTGATPNGTLPWHVHMGSCAEKGAIVGSPAAYTPITADAAGAARVEVTLPFGAPSTGSYSVNVHMSPTQMGMIVACAELRPQS